MIKRLAQAAVQRWRGRRKSVRKPKKPSGRKRGGQPGHKGSRRVMLGPELVDTVLDIFPQVCEICLRARRRSRASRLIYTRLSIFLRATVVGTLSSIVVTGVVAIAASLSLRPPRKHRIRPRWAHRRPNGVSGELRVSEVTTSGIAHRAGLENGDLLIRVSDASINENNAAAAKLYLESRAPGVELTIVVKRGNDTLSRALSY